MQASYDAIVVGSGFGGGIAACRLAEAGRRVCVLERGRRFGRDDFPGRPDQAGELVWHPAANPGGMFDVRLMRDLSSSRPRGSAAARSSTRTSSCAPRPRLRRPALAGGDRRRHARALVRPHRGRAAAADHPGGAAAAQGRRLRRRGRPRRARGGAAAARRALRRATASTRSAARRRRAARTSRAATSGARCTRRTPSTSRTSRGRRRTARRSCRCTRPSASSRPAARAGTGASASSVWTAAGPRRRAARRSSCSRPGRSDRRGCCSPTARRLPGLSPALGTCFSGNGDALGVAFDPQRPTCRTPRTTSGPVMTSALDLHRGAAAHRSPTAGCRPGFGGVLDIARGVNVIRGWRRWLVRLRYAARARSGCSDQSLRRRAARRRARRTGSNRDALIFLMIGRDAADGRMRLTPLLRPLRHPLEQGGQRRAVRRPAAHRPRARRGGAGDAVLRAGGRAAGHVHDGPPARRLPDGRRPGDERRRRRRARARLRRAASSSTGRSSRPRWA